MELKIPRNTLVVMVGASGSGKSSLAERLFPGCVVSSDTCRRILSGDALVGAVLVGKVPTSSNDIQKFSEGAFLLFHSWIRARLRHGLLTVADSTALRHESRADLQKIAEEEHAKVLYIFVDTPMDECIKRNSQRGVADRVPDAVITRQFKSLERSRVWLSADDAVYTVRPGDAISLQVVEDAPAEKKGPSLGIEATAIDVIGDVHGCMDELVELIEKLGYAKGGFVENEHRVYKHPEGRKLVFVGDLIDRGPQPYGVLDFVRRHVENNLAHLVLSNHERKLKSYLAGRNVRIKPDFQKTIDSIPADADKKALSSFLRSLRPYRQWYSPAGFEWVIAHAAYDPAFAGKVDGKIEEYCAYGPVNSVDSAGTPDRIAWWETYRPGPKVVYGHIITDDGKPRVINGTYGIDTGCVHGGSLTALRLPEEEFVQVKAKQVYHGTLKYTPKAELTKEPLEETLEKDFMQGAAAAHVACFAMARAASWGGHKELAQELVARMDNIKAYGDAANDLCQMRLGQTK